MKWKCPDCDTKYDTEKELRKCIYIHDLQEQAYYRRKELELKEQLRVLRDSRKDLKIKKWEHLAIRPNTFEKFNELNNLTSQNAFVVKLLDIYVEKLNDL